MLLPYRRSGNPKLSENRSQTARMAVTGNFCDECDLVSRHRQDTTADCDRKRSHPQCNVVIVSGDWAQADLWQSGLGPALVPDPCERHNLAGRGFRL